MLASQQSEFITGYRRKGVLASQVPARVAEPRITQVMDAPQDKLLSVGEAFTHKVTPGRTPSTA